MLQQLSFRLPPLYALLEKGTSLVPGSKRITAIYFDDNEGEVVCHDLNCASNEISYISLQKKIIEKYREDSNNRLWVGSSDFGQGSNSGKIKQLSLEDELDNNCLVLKFKNKIDNKFDVLVIHFNKDKNNFELEANPQPLDTKNKSIIAHLLYNTLNTFIQTHESNKVLFEQIARSNVSLQQHLQTTKTDLNITQSQLKESLQGNIMQYITPFEKASGKTITISDEAFEKLQQFKGSANELKNIIEQAANIAINLTFGNSVELYPEHFLLEQYHTKEIPADKEVEATDNKTKRITYNRYTKTIEMLDRYEKAARLLHDKEIPLTSKNVGLYCSPSISAPAISDAIKKHRNKILSLFEMHPEKWTILRTEFKPILNILPQGPELGKMLLGA